VWTECRFCGVPLTDDTRALSRCFDGQYRPRNKSWCVACDSLDAPTRARRHDNALRYAREREKVAAAQQRYRQSAKGRAARQRARAAKRWRDGTSFRCAGCHARFANARESWRLVDGVRKRLGMCRYCAEHHVGPSRHDGPLWQEAKRERARKARGLSVAA
jgi:hypothetical protein